MFELLEKQHLMSIFGALSGLLLFQDGVFANSFCDRLFAHIETDYDKITRSLHRNENSKFMKNKTCTRGRGNRIPAVKSKIPGKSFLKSESRTSVTFKLKFFTLDIYQWQLFGLSTVGILVVK